jgi:hypothetical protein
MRCACRLLELIQERALRPDFLWPAKPHIHPELHRAKRQAPRDIVADVAHERDCDIRQVLAGELAHRHEIRERLGRMGLIRQASSV